MTATLDTAYDEMAALVVSTWTGAGELSARIFFSGTRQDLPKDASNWLGVDIQFEDGFDASIAGRLFTRTGTIMLTIYTPGNHGDGAVLALSEAMLVGFDGVATTSGVRLFRGRVVGTLDDNPWRRANVVVDFEIDQLR